MHPRLLGVKLLLARFVRYGNLARFAFAANNKQIRPQAFALLRLRRDIAAETPKSTLLSMIL